MVQDDVPVASGHTRARTEKLPAWLEVYRNSFMILAQFGPIWACSPAISAGLAACSPGVSPSLVRTGGDRQAASSPAVSAGGRWRSTATDARARCARR